MDRVMLDSNVIIKHLLGEVDTTPVWQTAVVYYNPIVYSEVFYVLLLNETGERPFTLKKRPEIVKNAAENVITEMGIFREMLFLPVGKSTQTLAENLVKEYGLLPGDAMILATAIENRIDYLITEDRDLLRVGSAEGCQILQVSDYVKGVSTG